MKETIKTIYRDGIGEIIEKKSRFIGHVSNVETEEEAISYIDRIKKEHWNATHNCFAYIIGKKNQILRCSDDGEPSGTAGRPILDVIVGEGLHNVVVVVTRYFGGTLLGTGGLVRAYQQGTKAGLKNAVIIEKKAGHRLNIETDYNGIGKIQYLVNQLGVTELETKYTELVQMEVVLPMYLNDTFVSQVTEATSGRAKITKVSDVYFGEAEGELIIE